MYLTVQIFFYVYTTIRPFISLLSGCWMEFFLNLADTAHLNYPAIFLFNLFFILRETYTLRLPSLLLFCFFVVQVYKFCMRILLTFLQNSLTLKSRGLWTVCTLHLSTLRLFCCSCDVCWELLFWITKRWHLKVLKTMLGYFSSIIDKPMYTHLYALASTHTSVHLYNNNELWVIFSLSHSVTQNSEYPE